MAAYLRFRERFRKPTEFLEKLGLEHGHRVLDFGCGIGSYSIPAAKIVGEKGVVYALDIHPMAVERVKKRMMKAGLENIVTIQSGLETGLMDESLDFVLLIDVFTWIKDKHELLAELYRVIKPTGRFVMLIDHASPDECGAIVADTGLFNLESQEENVLVYLRC